MFTFLPLFFNFRALNFFFLYTIYCTYSGIKEDWSQRNQIKCSKTNYNQNKIAKNSTVVVLSFFVIFCLRKSLFAVVSFVLIREQKRNCSRKVNNWTMDSYPKYSNKKVDMLSVNMASQENICCQADVVEQNE